MTGSTAAPSTNAVGYRWTSDRVKGEEIRVVSRACDAQ